MSSSSAHDAFRNARSNLGDSNAQKKAELLKKAAEEKVEEAQRQAAAEAQKVKDDLAEVTRQRDDLEAKVTSLKKDKLAFEESERSLKQKIDDLEKAKTELNSSLTTMTQAKNKVSGELETEQWKNQRAISKLEAEVSYVRIGTNNLHPDFAGVPIRIISVKTGRALDAGQDSRTKCHTWEAGYQNGHLENQRFYLTRATKESPNDSAAGWWIQTWHDDRRLELSGGPNGQVRLATMNYSPTTGMGKAQQWYFGSTDHTPRGSYKITNRECGTHMSAGLSSLESNGGNITCVNSGSVNNLSWAIVPWAIDVTWDKYRK